MPADLKTLLPPSGPSADGGRRRLVRPAGSSPKPPLPPPPPDEPDESPDRWERQDSDIRIRGGKDGATLGEWTAMLSDAIPDLAIKAREMQRQIAVACLVEIKQFFESGNGGFDPISNLRRAISGYDHPPLHDLWRRLVIKDKQARRGYRRANPRAGIKGTPGVFAKGWGPCELRWVSEEWAKTALRLERGSVYPVNKEVRNAVFARAKANMGARQFKIFLSEFSGGTGYWQLPPRPFSHIFSSARMNARFREIGEQILAGTYKPSGDLAQPSKPAWTEDPRYKGEAASEFDVSYDDAAATWNALVAEGASPAGGGRHVGIKKRSE